MIKIFLCSSLADAAQLLSKFVVQLQRKIVAFIPTASINEEHTQYVVDGKTALKYLGLVVKELGALCDEKSIPQIIKDSDRIYISIIRKTKRFAIPERAVYFLKTKRTAGGTPPPQNIFDRLTPVFT